MDWKQIIITTTTAGIEPVSGRLYNVGITGVEIEDESEFLDFLEENKDTWDYVDEDLRTRMHSDTKVKIYIPDSVEGMDILTNVKQTLAELKEYDTNCEFGTLAIDYETLNEEDWANNWKKFFHPIEIGERLLICPEWEKVNDSDRIIFTINPGMTFGTGTHFTTQLCIEQLEKVVQEGDEMLDLGCGSGILSVISLMLGAKNAMAVDIDPNSQKIAYENADRNNVDKSKYTVLHGNVISQDEIRNQISAKKYNVIAANIVADVIIALAPYAKSVIADDGVFITSGIITERQDEVATAIKQAGFYIKDTIIRGDWVCMVCR